MKFSKVKFLSWFISKLEEKGWYRYVVWDFLLVINIYKKDNKKFSYIEFLEKPCQASGWRQP